MDIIIYLLIFIVKVRLLNQGFKLIRWTLIYLKTILNTFSMPKLLKNHFNFMDMQKRKFIINLLNKDSVL